MEFCLNLSQSLASCCCVVFRWLVSKLSDWQSSTRAYISVSLRLTIPDIWVFPPSPGQLPGRERRYLSSPRPARRDTRADCGPSVGRPQVWRGLVTTFVSSKLVSLGNIFGNTKPHRSDHLSLHHSHSVSLMNKIFARSGFQIS